MKDNLTGLQKMQIAYAHFTLEEWRLLAQCVLHRQASMQGTKERLDQETVKNLLTKFPSAVL